MIEILRRNPLVGALAFACVVFAAIVVLELVTGGPDPNRTVARKSAPAEHKLLPAVAAVSIDQVYPETVARPLWIPTRRPAPPAVAAQASFTRGQYTLLGVTIAGDTRIALLKEKASGRIHRAEKGRGMNGLQVAEVLPESVTLAQGAETEVIELLVQRPPGAAAAPGQPAAPGAPPQPQAQAVQGPFGPMAAQPPSPLAGHIPGTPVPIPSGPPMAQRPQGAPGPMSAPGPMGSPPAAPANPAVAPGVVNPPGATVPQPQSAAPMTPEELLARRRARRNQSP
jgi:general secretion pathway protein N